MQHLHYLNHILYVLASGQHRGLKGARKTLKRSLLQPTHVGEILQSWGASAWKTEPFRWVSEAPRKHGLKRVKKFQTYIHFSLSQVFLLWPLQKMH